MASIVKVFAPEEILWEKNRVVLKNCSLAQNVEIQYSDMVFAYMQSLDRQYRKWRKLQIFEIEVSTPGFVVIYARHQVVYEIHFIHMGIMAGKFMLDLAWNNEQVYIGYNGQMELMEKAYY